MIPPRIYYEITNKQAETALILEDQELLRYYLQQGIHGATVLNSKQRRKEAIEVYKKAEVVWPHEAQVSQLANLFL